MRHSRQSARRRVFLLEGIGGVHNYGCEAIVRGTVACLRHRWPDARIIYASRRHREDRASLAGLGIRVEPHTLGCRLPKRLFNGMARALRVPIHLPWGQVYEWASIADAVLSIGGDMFTLFPGQEQAERFPVVEEALRLQHAGVPVILWGASVGPFEENQHAPAAFREALTGMSLILVREEVTERYLGLLGIGSPVRRVADPAFLMDVPHPDEEFLASYLALSGTRVALNLSPLATAATGETADLRLVDNQRDLVERIVTDCEASVVLVPHVCSPWKPEDDDSGYLSRLHQALPPAVRSKVMLLPPDLGAVRTKQLVARCDVVVAARMHCAIAGMSSFVPTLLLSYSSKALGMCDYVYGSREWVCPVESPCQEIVVRLRELLRDKLPVRKLLVERMPAIRLEALAAAEHLSALLDGKSPVEGSDV